MMHTLQFIAPFDQTISVNFVTFLYSSVLKVQSIQHLFLK